MAFVSDLSPVVLFVYNRPHHTQKCLELLEKNKLAADSVLFIYADGVRADANEEELKKVDQVRNIINRQWRFKKIILIENPVNKGIYFSMVPAITDIINKFEKIIVLEDDIMTSPGFLRFMNEGLFLYANYEKVFGCAGYAEPVGAGRPSYCCVTADRQIDTFFNKKGTSWGWATWKRMWIEYLAVAKDALASRFTEKQIKEFNIGRYPFYEMLKANHLPEMNLWNWDIDLYAHSFLNNGLWLTPVKSLVINIGFTSGSHSGSSIFYSDDVAEFIKVNKITVIEDEKMKKKIGRFYRNNFSPELFYKIKRKLLAIRKAK